MNNGDYDSTPTNTTTPPLIRLLSRRKSSVTPQYVNLKQLKNAFQTQADQTAYTNVFQTIDRMKLQVGVSRVERTSSQPHRIVVPKPKSDPTFSNGWFADRRHMKFKMDSFYSNNLKTEQSETRPLTASTLNQTLQPRMDIKRSYSFQRDKKSPWRLKQEEKQHHRRVIQSYQMPMDQARFQFQGLMRQINNEVQVEQAQQYTYTSPPQQVLENAEVVMERLCNQSRINMKRLKVMRSVAYRTPMDKLIEMLKR